MILPVADVPQDCILSILLLGLFLAIIPSQVMMALYTNDIALPARSSRKTLPRSLPPQSTVEHLFEEEINGKKIARKPTVK